MAISVALPPTHRALKVVQSSAFTLEDNASLPALASDSVLVRVACVAINPVDGKSADMSPAPGATSGTDFAGIVVALGAGVSSGSEDASPSTKVLRVGDRVMGFVFGNNRDDLDNGAFAEYVSVPRSFVWCVPDTMDLPTATTLPAAMASVGLSLHYLQLSMPSAPAKASFARSSSALKGEADSRPFVLVYGGGTSTGAVAIQVLVYAGFTVITTCSPSSAARAKELGAVATFDYQSPMCGRDILEHTKGQLSLALDCISESSSMSICYEAIGPSGGRYVALDPFPIRGHVRRSIVPDWLCTYTQFGSSIPWAPPYNLDARPDDRRFAEEWYAVSQQMLDGGFIKAPPKEVRSSGMESLPQGIEEVRRGVVKGKKLVYMIEDGVCAQG